MARQHRIEYPGAFYHVMARGDRREPIVENEADRRDFLEVLGRACGRTNWRVHGWVLMSNHYHWLIETPEPNLVVGMKWFQNTYSRRFNLRSRKWGHVFGGRYKAVLLDPEDGDGFYFERLLDYIHLNPLRAGLATVGQGTGLIDYPWSSLAQGYAVPSSRRADWMEVSAALARFGCGDTVAGRRRFVRSLEDRAGEAKAEEGPEASGKQTLQSTLQRGWYWGSETLKEKLLKLKTSRGRPGGRDHRLSRQARDHSEATAEEMVRVALLQHCLQDADLPKLPGSHPAKVELAAELCASTTVDQRWIAQRLFMGSPGNVSQQLYRRRKSRPE